jgi:hypothetical protein
VALNTDRLPDSEAGKFFRELMKRWPQGLWVVTPEGQTLGFHYHQPVGSDNFKQNQQRWVSGTVQMLEKAKQAAGDLAVRDATKINPYPERGVGLLKDGGVRLAVSVIGLRAERQEGPPVIDSFLLSKEDWASFAPSNGQLEWTVAETAAKKFAPAFSPVTDSIFVPRAKDVNRANATAKVIRQDGIVVIQYRGEWQSEHNRDGNPKFPIRNTSRAEGIGEYDPEKKQLRSLLMLLKGTYRNGENTIPTASVIEWVAE